MSYVAGFAIAISARLAGVLVKSLEHQEPVFGATDTATCLKDMPVAAADGCKAPGRHHERAPLSEQGSQLAASDAAG